MKTLKHYAEKSINIKQDHTESCDIALDVDGECFQAYEVSISYRDLLFFCDKGTINYLVDSYGDRVSIDLFNVSKDGE